MELSRSLSLCKLAKLILAPGSLHLPLLRISYLLFLLVYKSTCTPAAIMVLLYSTMGQDQSYKISQN